MYTKNHVLKGNKKKHLKIKIIRSDVSNKMKYKKNLIFIKLLNINIEEEENDWLFFLYFIKLLYIFDTSHLKLKKLNLQKKFVMK